MYLIGHRYLKRIFLLFKLLGLKNKGFQGGESEDAAIGVVDWNLIVIFLKGHFGRVLTNLYNVWKINQNLG